MESYHSYDELVGIIQQHQGTRKAARAKFIKMIWDQNRRESSDDMGNLGRIAVQYDRKYKQKLSHKHGINLANHPRPTLNLTAPKGQDGVFVFGK
jgi:Ni,Fe-hydrogenase I large subunit